MDNKPEKTFTKKWMDIILTVTLIDLQIPFILAFMDKMQIAETLGGLLVTEIIGVFLVYCVKSFFGKREEENIKLKKFELDNLTESDEENIEG